MKIDKHNVSMLRTYWACGLCVGKFDVSTLLTSVTRDGYKNRSSANDNPELACDIVWFYNRDKKAL